MGRRYMKKNLLRILIVEDNIDHVELLSQVIERHFAPVDLHTVETVDDAIDFIEQTDYDLVLTDCFINNESIVKQIPNLRSKLGNVPIIVITGSGDESLAAKVIRKGATDYLVKTRDSMEKIPALIKKYSQRDANGHEIYKGLKQEGRPIKDRIMDEVASLGRQARRVADPHGGRIPDLKQLESLLDQIQRLKDLASKLMEK